MTVKKLLFRKAMRWELEVEDFVKGQMQGYSLNVPAGESPIGDVKGDIEPRNDNVTQVDMARLP